MNNQDERERTTTLLENVVGLFMRKLGTQRVRVSLLEIAKLAASDSMDITLDADALIIRREPRDMQLASGLWLPISGLSDVRDFDGAARK